MSKRALHPGMVIVLGVLLAAALAGLHRGQLKSETVHVGNADIGGVVTSAKGPEAGVWVIAETTELPTKFVKIVVTDDQGRYLVPDLPKANYNVWVRGYGLVDSPKVKSHTGQDPEPEGGAWRRTRRLRSNTIPRCTGSRCCRCRPRAISPARGRAATALLRASRARANGFARSSTRTAAPAVIRWATRPRARFRKSILSHVAGLERRVGSPDSSRPGRRRG